MYAISALYPYFPDADGSALENGKLYFGTANQNPETSPITVYWDAAGTQPVSQPVRTIAGLPVRNGTPGNIYLSGSFSITVKDANDVLVYSLPTFSAQIDASGVNFLQLGTGAVTRTVESKEQDILSIKDFGVVADGTTVETIAKVQAAFTSAITRGLALFVPGLCLITSGITVGNTAPTIGQPLTVYGAGPGTGFKTLTAGITAVTVAGTNPLVDVGRYIGRATFRDLSFQGPGGFAPGGTGTGLFFDGAQGIVLDRVYFNGWANNLKLSSVDLFTAKDCWFQYGTYGVYNVEDAASFSYPGGVLNSGVFENCKFLHNATSGLYIWGGTSQKVSGCNFVANGIGINVASPVGINAVAVGTKIHNNYFENNTTNDISIGGAGICRVGAIFNNTSLVANGVTAIRLFNVSNSGGYGYVANNQMSAISGSFTAISQAGSAETWDVDGQNGSGYRPGSVISIVKTGIAAAGASNILKVSTFALPMQGILTVKASSAGLATTKVFAVSIMGSGNTVASITPLVTQNYSGGASTFTLTDTVDTPVAGTNTLSLNNTSGATCRFDCQLQIIDLGGTLTLL